MNGLGRSLFFLWILVLALVVGAPGLSAKSIDFGQYHALLIANQNYQNWKPLKTPKNDVFKLEAILKDKYGFSTEILPNATRDQIVDKLESYKVLLTDHDNLLIYYAGHGTRRKDGGYWIGIDGKMTSRSRWLHFSTINDLIDADYGMKARHVLVISDSCYAGAITQSEDEVPKKLPGESDRAWFLRMNTKRSRTALTSGGTEPVIDRAGSSTNSIFAQELIRRLESNSKVLEASSLYGLIKKDVHARARRIVGNNAQAPDYDPIPGTGDNGGDFMFVSGDSVISIEGIAAIEIKDFGIRSGTAVQREITNNLGMNFVYIAPGTFNMGSPELENGRDLNEFQHQVTLTKGFYLQTTEVTQDQWNAVMWRNPSGFTTCGGNCPVERVSWNEVQEFISSLNAKAGRGTYRLPYEAEWEYAARAGTQTPFAFGRCLSSTQANYDADRPYKGCAEGVSLMKTTKVGNFPANEWGLFDMHGNVSEWCQDWYQGYPKGRDVLDPKGRPDGTYRAIRGGSWKAPADECRTAFRSGSVPEYRYASLGFRLVYLPEN